RVDYDAVGDAPDVGVDLALVGERRADRVYVQPAAQPAAEQRWTIRTGGGRGNEHLHAVDGRLGPIDRRDLDAELLAHLAREPLAPLGAAAIDPRAPQRAHSGHGFDFRARLRSGTDDPER